MCLLTYNSDLLVAWLIIIRPMLLMVSSEQTLCSVAHIAKVGNGKAQAQSIRILYLFIALPSYNCQYILIEQLSSIKTVNRPRLYAPNL